LRWTPQAAAGWSEDEVRRRWLLAHPPKAQAGAAGGAAAPPDSLPAEARLSATARRQLGSLSSFMKHFKQMLAHRINRLLRRRGRLWHGRFRMAPLADASAVAAVMAFVDLRPVAQAGGTRPEEAPFTSLHARVGRYQAMFGMNADNLPPQDEAAVFGPEVAQILRDDAGAEPLAPPATEPLPGGMPGEMPGEMPDGMPALGGMDGMGGMPPGDPLAPPVPAFNAPWLLALQEDGPRAILRWLPLSRYLKLLDALVDKVKSWPHLPANAPGRAPVPPTPAWAGALTALLSAMGLDAAQFEAQWRRLAGLRG
jgi:hypothetical protein